MSAKTSDIEVFFALFARGDVDGVAALFERQPELVVHRGHDAHPLLRQFTNDHPGHIYRDTHVLIAEQLTPVTVRAFRDSVFNDQFEDVARHLDNDPELIHAEFTTCRGISQAIHCCHSLPVLQLAADSGADLDVLTSRGDTPLTLKLRGGDVEAARFLLEGGANPNLGVGFHMPSRCMVELIELLLKYGWDIRHAPLLHDANHGHGKRVITWLKYGANPNAKNADGQTALHLLAAKGIGRDAIRALVKAGADIHAKDHRNNTPLDLSRLASKNAAAQELISLGAGNSNA